VAAAPHTVLTWDTPHRLWHWLFAASICVSLYTGLDGGIDAMDLHVVSGVAVIGLLLFRLGWALWGGRYVRFREYRTSVAAMLRQFRGRAETRGAHSAAGAAMALVMVFAVLLQAGSGLFASDDIVTDGPYAHLVSRAGVDLATAIHTRAYWLVLGLALVHVGAVAWYAARRDPIALSMLNGRTAAPIPALHDQPWMRALLTAFAAAAIVWFGARAA
jgi:cytochrome b